MGGLEGPPKPPNLRSAPAKPGAPLSLAQRAPRRASPAAHFHPNDRTIPSAGFAPHPAMGEAAEGAIDAPSSLYRIGAQGGEPLRESGLLRLGKCHEILQSRLATRAASGRSPALPVESSGPCRSARMRRTSGTPARPARALPWPCPLPGSRSPCEDEAASPIHTARRRPRRGRDSAAGTSGSRQWPGIAALLKSMMQWEMSCGEAHSSWPEPGSARWAPRGGGPQGVLSRVGGSVEGRSCPAQLRPRPGSVSIVQRAERRHPIATLESLRDRRQLAIFLGVRSR